MADASASILSTIKKMNNSNENYEGFDVDIIVHINAALSNLNQLGVVSSKRARIEDDSTEWSDLGVSDDILGWVQDYVYFKVKVAFDPPENSAVLESYNKSISELEWRLREQVEGDRS